MSEQRRGRPQNDISIAKLNGGLMGHGGAQLPLVHVDTYNEEMREARSFVGDRASKKAFSEILETWRKRLRRHGDDPLGPDPEVKKKKLDKLLAEGNVEEAGLVESVIEDFAQQFAQVVERFLRVKSWRGTGCILVGGGLSGSRVGELAIARAAAMLKAKGRDVELKPIRYNPDEAGLIGGVYLAPSWVLRGHDAMLAVDIGGSNIRAGTVEFKFKKASDQAKCAVADFELWRYAELKEQPSRDEAVEHVAEMLRTLADRAVKSKLKLAPFVGIGCPGLIRADGSIERGAQNLPGNWESQRFNLPRQLHELMPRIGEHGSMFVMHNDAVVQGLSEAPFMRKVKHWGVLTIGTGLGNARFTSVGSGGKAKSDDKAG
jgi:predicted NBD/HSP70 family sugar kinase